MFWYHTIYQSNTRFVHDNSPLTSSQNFRQKENLWKLKTSLTSFIFLSSLPIPAGVINFPTMCEQSFLADNVARRMPLKVSADQWRVPTEEKEERKKKKKAESKRIYLLLVLRVHNENNQALRVDASLYARDSLERISSRLVKGVVILKFSTENVRWIDSCIS